MISVTEIDNCAGCNNFDRRRLLNNNFPRDVMLAMIRSKEAFRKNKMSFFVFLNFLLCYVYEKLKCIKITYDPS
jgi:hypothetical protein